MEKADELRSEFGSDVYVLIRRNGRIFNYTPRDKTTHIHEGITKIDTSGYAARASWSLHQTQPRVLTEAPAIFSLQNQNLAKTFSQVIGLPQCQIQI